MMIQVEGMRLWESILLVDCDSPLKPIMLITKICELFFLWLLTVCQALWLVGPGAITKTQKL